MGVIDAERAFAADAQRLGQWAAFRKWAAADATMFVPQPVKAQEWLKDRAEPAKAIEWWPTAAWVSCDGSLAVDTGGWRRPDGSVGYFTTAWLRQPDGGWKWVLDHGDMLEAPRPAPEQPVVTTASFPTRATDLWRLLHVPPPGKQVGKGLSPDGSLAWAWIRGGGKRTMLVVLHDRGTVLRDEVAE